MTLDVSTDAHADVFSLYDSDDEHLSHCSWYMQHRCQDSWCPDFLPTNVTAWSVPSNLRSFQTMTVSGTPATKHHCLITICHQVQCLPFRMLNQAVTIWSFGNIHQAFGRALLSSFFIRRRRCKIQVIIWRIDLFVSNCKGWHIATFVFDILIIWNNNRRSIRNQYWPLYRSHLPNAFTNQVPGSVGASTTRTFSLHKAATPRVVGLKTAISNCLQHIRHLLQW